MKSQLRPFQDGEDRYEMLVFVCPGCAEATGGTGLHMLPVNTTIKLPSWTFDGDLDAPTLDPSILTETGTDEDGHRVTRCHSYLRAGVFQFLDDCTHSLAGTSVPMPDLPDWYVERTGG